MGVQVMGHMGALCSFCNFSRNLNCCKKSLLKKKKKMDLEAWLENSITLRIDVCAQSLSSVVSDSL